MQFEMQILNIFRFANGQTLFVGRVLNHPETIKTCHCVLMFNNEIYQEISIEGEQMVKKFDPNNDLQAIATSEEIKLTEEQAKTGQWKLASVKKI